jgi:DNA-binding SARP family transcriptional activator
MGCTPWPTYAEQQEWHLAQAVAHTRRLLALEPWREEAHRRLMAVLAAQRATGGGPGAI